MNRAPFGPRQSPRQSHMRGMAELYSGVGLQPLLSKLGRARFACTRTARQRPDRNSILRCCSARPTLSSTDEFPCRPPAISQGYQCRGIGAPGMTPPLLAHDWKTWSRKVSVPPATSFCQFFDSLVHARHTSGVQRCWRYGEAVCAAAGDIEADATANPAARQIRRRDMTTSM